MKQLFLFLFMGLLLIGCKFENKSDGNLSVSSISDNATFNFSDFGIRKGGLGPIEIGMTIGEAEGKIEGLSRKTCEAMQFGFDGGGLAYLYSLKDELVFGLIPKYQTDTLLFIVAVHKNLETTNGLNPNATVEELIQQYPDIMVHRNLMNGWEFFKDEKRQWHFVFKTAEKKRVGEYPENRGVDVPSKPKRLEAKTDWVTIQ